MKHILLIAFLCTSCVVDSPSDLPKDFSFLEGDWTRVNEKDGTSTSEHWIAIEGNQWKGVGLSLSEKDTVFYEDMLITPIDSTWKLEVKGPNEAPIYFEIVDQSENGFTAKNPDHDFPKEIKYWLDSDTLKANVSGDEMSIDFAFVRR